MIGERGTHELDAGEGSTGHANPSNPHFFYVEGGLHPSRERRPWQGNMQETEGRIRLGLAK